MRQEEVISTPAFNIAIVAPTIEAGSDVTEVADYHLTIGLHAHKSG